MVRHLAAKKAQVLTHVNDCGILCSLAAYLRKRLWGSPVPVACFQAFEQTFEALARDQVGKIRTMLAGAASNASTNVFRNALYNQ